MKILYRQEANDSGILTGFGITDCYFKQLAVADERNHVTKLHHHTCYEMHFITQGSQIYLIDGCEYRLNVGDFLLIYPNVRHKTLESDAQTEKTAITFHFSGSLPGCCCTGHVTPRVQDSLALVCEEAAAKKGTSLLLMENRIFEVILWALRLGGITEQPAETVIDEHAVIQMARQYIADNIDHAPSVAEVAQYCHISTKQLVRNFNRFTGTAPGQYIKKERVQRICQLLAEDRLTLRQISEELSFSSEYYFNVFFKTYAGMPPGEYRRMMGK